MGPTAGADCANKALLSTTKDLNMKKALCTVFKATLVFAGLALTLAAVSPNARAALITFPNNGLYVVLGTGPTGNITAWSFYGVGYSTQTTSQDESEGSLSVGGSGDEVTTLPTSWVNCSSCGYGAEAFNSFQLGTWTVSAVNNNYTYTYTGSDFSYVAAGGDTSGDVIPAPWTTSDFISASFTFTGPLPDNVALYSAASYQEQANVTSWSVSDGVFLFSGSQATSLVPESSTMALIPLAGAILLIARRWKERTSWLHRTAGSEYPNICTIAGTGAKNSMGKPAKMATHGESGFLQGQFRPKGTRS